MFRRRLIVTLVLALIALPMAAGAIPHLEGTTSPVAPTETDVGPPLTVPATAPFPVNTPALQDNRHYILEITGTWTYDNSNTCNKADMAFSTTICPFVQGTLSGRGLIIDGTNQSDPKVLSPSDFRPNHKYRRGIVGKGSSIQLLIYDSDGTYWNNSGSLTVQVKQLSMVTYSIPIGSGPLPQVGGQGFPVNPPINAVPQVVPTQTVTVADEVSTPEPISVVIETRHVGNNYCLFINGMQIGQCVFDVTLNLFGIPIPERSVTPTASQTVCKNGAPAPTTQCSIGVSQTQVNNTVNPFLQPRTIAWPLPQVQIREGSELRFTITWSARVDKLHFVGREPFLETGATLWAPFNYNDPAEQAWFSANMASVAASIDMDFFFPDGPDPGSEPDKFSPDVPPVVIPGFGQILEAMFASCAPTVMEPDCAR